MANKTSNRAATALKTETSSPSVRHVVTALEQRIRAGEYRDGQWLPSERILADEFGVSRVIIRDAMRTIEARGLLLRAARCRPVVKLPANSSRTLSRPATRRRSIALLVWPNPSWPGSAMLVQGIRQTLPQNEFRLVLETAIGADWSEVHASEAQFLKRLAEDRDIEGLILWYLGGDENRPALETVRECGIPMVFLDRRPPLGFDADFVGVDNAGAAQRAVQHLISLGHRHIAHISNLDFVSTVEERFLGYRRALTHAGIPFRPELVLRDPGTSMEDYREDCAPLVEALIALPDAPTAVFAVNDIVAHRVVMAIRERGLRVPEDISVVGFDGIERWGTALPFLTTADQPFEHLGAVAAELLQERIGENTPATAYRHILLDAPLTVRGSTARRHRPGAGTPSPGSQGGD